jgi:hypothetical protein
MATTLPVSPPSSDNRGLEELARAPVESLRESWARRFGWPPPKSLSRRLLVYAAAYEAQAKIHGALKPAVRRRLLQALTNHSSTVREGSGRKPPVIPPAGSRLVREWQGRSYMVEVTARGFFYAGQHYRSLSEIARVITGARWSGPRFFGL